jgi:hypothetical protein|tara:strand:- start:599 stop:940 length:342 start_codon:yes stop_codon:yes gene_type:complete
LHKKIEVIEAGYEYLLAYAAQGKETDKAGSGISEVRQTLTNMANAVLELIEIHNTVPVNFSWVLIDDANKAHAAIDLVLTQKSISSEIVDNLNASIHLRALLTDLFLLSEAEN